LHRYTTIKSTRKVLCFENSQRSLSLGLNLTYLLSLNFDLLKSNYCSGTSLNIIIIFKPHLWVNIIKFTE